MGEERYGGHSVSRLTVHLVWVTKYRFNALTEEIQKRCRELLIPCITNLDGQFAATYTPCVPLTKPSIA